MEKGLVNILLLGLCSNYPPSQRPSTTTPYPTYIRQTSSSKDGFACKLKTDEDLKRDYLHNRVLKIATLQYDHPLSNLEIDSVTKRQRVGGVAGEILEVLQEKFGFNINYTVVLPEKDIIGNENEGIFGLLKEGKVDMAAAFLPVVPGSHKIVKWGVDMIQNDYYVLMKRPGESASGSGLMAPFDKEVWLLILLSLLVVGPVMYLVMYLRVRICEDAGIKVYPLSACVWFVYGALMKQGSTLSPTADSTRMLFATWWLFIMILTAFYTANLTAFLTLSRFTLPIENIDGIARTKSKWFAAEGGAIEDAVKSGLDDKLKQLKPSLDRGLGKFINTADNRTVKDNIDSDWLYLEENRKLKEFLLDDYSYRTKQGIEEKLRCVYVSTSKPYLSRNLAFAYPLTTKLPALFDPIVLSFVESGIIQHRAQQLLPEAVICPLDLASKERQLRNSDLWTTYIIVVSGFSTAFTVFVAELVWRRWLRPRHPRLTSWPLDVSLHNPDSLAVSRYIGGKSKQGATVHINGRDYYIVLTKNGERRFIPIRTPSALLFQYAPK